MKPFIRSAFLFFVAIISGIFGCQKQDNTCHSPIREWPIEANTSRWLLQPFKPGDSILFKVFRKDKLNGGKYIYLRDESFYVKDTFIEKVTEKNEYRDFNCNEWMLSDYLSADIKGPENFKCQLSNTSITELILNFQGKKFRAGADQYNSNKFDWDDSLSILGKEYYNIKRCKGIDADRYYVDSTYSFYNIDYGIIKFIINDTLIYQRFIR